jgi:signal transduction histidine kinase
VGVVTSAPLISLSFEFASDSAARRAQQQVTQQIAIIAANFNEEFSTNLRRSLKSTASSEILSAFLSASQTERPIILKRLETYFLRLANDYDSYSGIYYVDAEGRVTVSVADKHRNTMTGTLTDPSVSAAQQPKSPTRLHLEELFHRMKSIPLLLSSGNMEWFIPPREAQTIGPFIDEEGRLSVLAGLSTMDYDSGAFAGVIVIRQSLNRFATRLKSVKFFDENPVWLFDTNGHTIMTPANATTTFNPNKLVSQKYSDTAKFRKLSDGLVAYRDLSIIPDKPFMRIAFAISSSLLVKDFEPTKRFFLLVLIASTAIVFLVALLVSRNFSKPIVELANAASRLASGDLSTQVNVKATGEVQVLVDSFNQMTGNLQIANTELKSTAEELKLALEKEKELNKLQRQFVAMASHEFRTPLAIIDSTAERLKRRVDRLTPEEAIKRVDKIRDAVKRMVRLMESTLAAARMEEGKISVEIGTCHIGRLLRELCVRQQEIEKTHTFNCELTDLPATIQADYNALEQVFTNLLSNAAKYSPGAPRIDVIARREGDEVVIAVRDRGIGIDEDDLPKMFERFFRAKTSTGIAGTGIGLNLVKTLVEMHGGTTSVESKKGEGSTFIVRLPIDGPNADRKPDSQAA